MLELYTTKDIEDLRVLLNLTEKEYHTIDVKEEEEYNFDGYADVLKATVHIFNSDTPTKSEEYSAVITHEALYYDANGED